MAAKKTLDWSQIENGAYVHMRKPVSFNRADEHLEIVLCYWPGGAQEWVTWLYNRENGGCSGGHYFDSREKAVEDFKIRGHLYLVEHVENDDELKPGNWVKVKKQPTLGSDQAGMLRSIKERQSWYIGSGWSYGTTSRSKRIAESLVKKGLVVMTEETRFSGSGLRKVYRLTERAEDLFEKPGRFWKYKEGAIKELVRPRHR